MTTSLTIIIIIFIILLIYFGSYVDQDTEYFTPFEVLTPYKYIKKNIDLLKKSLEFLESNNLTYWAIGGTLLGAIRDKGMIPWDDDLDISMPDPDVEKLLKMKNSLMEKNIGIAEWQCGYKLYDLNGNEIKGKEYKYPFIDIFPMKKNENGDYIYSSEQAQAWWPDIYYVNELFPLKKYKFEDFYVYSMNDPINLLNNSYPGWQTKGLKSYDHQNEKKLNKVEFPIEYNKYKKPYLWTYWDNISDDSTPAIINLCYKTLIVNCSESFDIVRLDKNSILKYLPELNDYKEYTDKLRIAHKVDLYRIMLLYKYGGLYIDADTIVLRDPIEIMNKLDKHEYVGFGCTGNKCLNGYGLPSNGIMAARPHSILMAKVLENVLNKIKTNQSFDYFDLGKYIIWEEIKEMNEYEYHHYPNKYDGTRDKYGNWVQTNIIFSDTPIEYEDEKNMIFFTLYNSEINNNIRKMTENELLSKNWNFTKYIKKGLRM